MNKFTRLFSLVMVLFAVSVAFSATSSLAAVPDPYWRIAQKHHVDPRKVYQTALKHSGRQGIHLSSEIPWPWSARLCSHAKSKCEHFFLQNRQALFTLLQAGETAGMQMAIGPLMMPWNSQVQAQIPSLWAATHPLVSINWVVAHQFAKAPHVQPENHSNPHIATQIIGPAKPVMRSARAKRFTPLINRIAHHEGVNPALVHAMIAAESAYNPMAVSSAGAGGLMQLMPATATDYCLSARERFIPEKNIRAGVRYLKHLQGEFNQLDLVLAAYNAGPGAVKKYGWTIPPYRETREYVKRVKRFLRARS